jgi:hypothetical protein
VKHSNTYSWIHIYNLGVLMLRLYKGISSNMSSTALTISAYNSWLGTLITYNGLIDEASLPPVLLQFLALASHVNYAAAAAPIVAELAGPSFVPQSWSRQKVE